MPPNTEDLDQRPLPALWSYVNRVYLAMKDAAAQRVINPDAEQPDYALIYEGHLTHVFSSLEIPNPYYTSVTRALRSMGCVEQLRRGGGSAKSRWVLLGEPTEEAFLALGGGNKHLHKHVGRGNVFDQRLRDLTSTVRALEKRVERLERRSSGPLHDSSAE